MSKKQSIDICPLCERSTPIEGKRPLCSIDDILTYLDHFRNKQQEYLISLSLDGKRQVITRRVVTIGLLDTALAHPREVFAGPLADRAASIIIAHNHPSGDATPSQKDIELTQQLAAAGQLLGIPLKDHIIVATKNHYSFKGHSMV